MLNLLSVVIFLSVIMDYSYIEECFKKNVLEVCMGKMSRCLQLMLEALGSFPKKGCVYACARMHVHKNIFK